TVGVLLLEARLALVEALVHRFVGDPGPLELMLVLAGRGIDAERRGLAGAVVPGIAALGVLGEPWRDLLVFLRQPVLPEIGRFDEVGVGGNQLILHLVLRGALAGSQHAKNRRRDQATQESSAARPACKIDSEKRAARRGSLPQRQGYRAQTATPPPL